MNRREFVAIAALPYLARAQRSAPASDYPAAPVSYRDVEINDAFWTPWLNKVRTVSMPHLFDLGEKMGRMDMRIIQGASYFVAKNPNDQALRNRLDGWMDKVIPTVRGGQQRGGGGDVFLGGVAYYEATGSRKLLDAAIARADDMVATFGPDRSHLIANHEGVEMALVSLYRVTGDERHLRLAKFFVDERGSFEKSGRPSFTSYAQDHEPVKAQTRAIGHCVRATYLYNAVTDVAALTADADYARTIERIWEDAVSKRTYLTGGIGSYRHEENFGDAYDLPNLGCWNEICAACGNTWWNHRLFLLNRDAKYIDMMERILYNGLLAGISLIGDRFLYQAPLKAYGSFERQPQFGPNCCPPNITRLLASFGNLIYAQDNEGLYVNLFAGSKARVKLSQTPVTVEQQTRYPWEGGVRLTVNPESASKFAVRIRIPGWSRGEVMPGGLYRFSGGSNAGFTLTVNGRRAPYTLERGFAKIEREWTKGDTVELDIPMPVQKVLAREEVADDRGMVALERGPIVYCAEGTDNGGAVFNLLVPNNAVLRFARRTDILAGTGTLTGTVLALHRGPDGGPVEKREQAFTAVPYYLFGNRGTGEMAVWLAREEARVELPPKPTIASTSKATSSCGNGTFEDNYPAHKLPTAAQRLYPSTQDGSGDIRAICDQIEPVNSEDESSYYLRLHPQSGDQAWVQYDFAKAAKVSSVDVYWKDDKQYCVLPRSWRLLYRDGEEWKPVNATGSFGVEKDRFNTVKFEPVTTSALRMEIQLQAKTYKKGLLGPPDANWLSDDFTWYEGGVIEWRVNA